MAPVAQSIGRIGTEIETFSADLGLMLMCVAMEQEIGSRVQHESTNITTPVNPVMSLIDQIGAFWMCRQQRSRVMIESITRDANQE